MLCRSHQGIVVGYFGMKILQHAAVEMQSDEVLSFRFATLI
jgi:hypothetical protein